MAAMAARRAEKVRYIIGFLYWILRKSDLANKGIRRRAAV